MPVIGIVSTKPGFYLGGFNDELYPNDKKIPIALSGRVPLKVSTESGSIKKGDRIVLSSLPGVGMKATTSGMAVAIALEDFSGATDPNVYSTTSPVQVTVNGNTYIKGDILAFVNLSYAQIDNALAAATSTLATNAWAIDQVGELTTINFNYDINLQGHALLNVSRITGFGGKWSIDENGKIIAQNIETKNLKVESGVTTIDKTTGNPYCMYVSGGVVMTASGDCAAMTASSGGGLSVPSTPSTTSTTTDAMATSTPTDTITTTATTTDTTATADTSTTTPVVSDSTVPADTSTTTPAISDATITTTPTI